MKIAVIGTGNVGGTLGSRWAGLGHAVIFGSRDPRAPRVQELLQRAGSNASAATIAQAAAEAEVVVLAVPWSNARETIKSAGKLAGKIVIDCSNPLSADFGSLAIGHTTSAGEQVAGWAAGARVVKAFNNTGAGNMADPAYGDTAVSMFICGDDAKAKKTVRDLAAELGFDVVDAGGLTAARYLEPLCMLWITLAYGMGLGPNIAFRLLRR